jgi:hypothetical protein
MNIDKNYIFKSGKYKGTNIIEVIKSDKSYIKWCIENKAFNFISSNIDEGVLLLVFGKKKINLTPQIDYNQYIRSNKWKKKKKDFRNSKLCKQKCYICGSTKSIHIHHKSYKELGKEYLYHLIELCASCHLGVHEKLNSSNSQKTNLWNIARKVKKQYEKSQNKK